MIENFRFDAAVKPARDPRFDELNREVFLEEVAQSESAIARMRRLEIALRRERRAQNPQIRRNANRAPMPPLPEKPTKERLLQLARAVEAGWEAKNRRGGAQ